MLATIALKFKTRQHTKLRQYDTIIYSYSNSFDFY